MISTVPLCFNSHCTSVNIIIILLCEKHVHSTTKNLLDIRHINSLVHEYLHIYVQLSTGRYGILQKCLTLTCEDKMRDVSPASSMKLKISIYIQVLCMMVSGYSQGRGEAMTIPLQVTATYYSNKR